MISVVIRTLNEARHLDALLGAIANQRLDRMEKEVIVVDSGSTDATLEIAQTHDARIAHVRREEFTFGRSLNMGCAAACGDYLVFVSGHCIPQNDQWLARLIEPLRQGGACYAYGRQIANHESRFSERELFKKYYPESGRNNQSEIFCNNANAALLRDTWARYRFDEELTGLEDMELGARLVKGGSKIAYVADAAVYHIHDETWSMVRTRFEREAVALQRILPQVHIRFSDFLRYLFGAILLDSGAALQERVLLRTFPEIVMFRLMQFWGAYKGNHIHRKLSHEMKERYFYPK